MITLTKEELLRLLEEKTENSAECDHIEAEGWLLNFIDDPVLKKAWEDRKERQGWSYGENTMSAEDYFGKRPANPKNIVKKLKKGK